MHKGEDPRPSTPTVLYHNASQTKQTKQKKNNKNDQHNDHSTNL